MPEWLKSIQKKNLTEDKFEINNSIYRNVFLNKLTNFHFKQIGSFIDTILAGKLSESPVHFLRRYYIRFWNKFLAHTFLSPTLSYFLSFFLNEEKIYRNNIYLIFFSLPCVMTI